MESMQCHGSIPGQRHKKMRSSFSQKIIFFSQYSCTTHLRVWTFQSTGLSSMTHIHMCTIMAWPLMYRVHKLIPTCWCKQWCSMNSNELHLWLWCHYLVCSDSEGMTDCETAVRVTETNRLLLSLVPFLSFSSASDIIQIIILECLAPILPHSHLHYFHRKQFFQN